MGLYLCGGDNQRGRHQKWIGELFRNRIYCALYQRQYFFASIQVGENESSKYWLSVLNELQNRVVKDILILCADGPTGIKEAIAVVYPPEYQRRLALSSLKCYNTQGRVVHAITKFSSWEHGKELSLCRLSATVCLPGKNDLGNENRGVWVLLDSGPSCPPACRRRSSWSVYRLRCLVSKYMLQYSGYNFAFFRSTCTALKIASNFAFHVRGIYSHTPQEKRNLARFYALYVHFLKNI